mmetsp:Transcript_26725/g.31102  ORF Transcript_26725/g.31102 Transcript_26725/m.31102 type:complete len:519 (+) Transcript_26725:85-1641(+)
MKQNIKKYATFWHKYHCQTHSHNFLLHFELTKSRYIHKSTFTHFKYNAQPLLELNTHSNSGAGSKVFSSSTQTGRRHSENDVTESNRKVFKSIPVNPSVLSYIKKIGVGIRQTQTNKKKKKSRKEANFLSERDEEDFFNVSNKGSARRPRSHGQLKTVQPKEGSLSSSSVSKRVSSFSNNHEWVPPAPFSSSRTVGEWVDEIKRLPVKIVGSVGTMNEKMPSNSKGLPEVAVIGRSNVGKSTLINALLYGNQYNEKNADIIEKKFVRGKTPEGAKLGKGVKASVSAVPGETKRITWYLLSSHVMKPSNNVEYDDVDDSNEITTLRKKYTAMSLVLVDLPGFGFAYTSENKAKEWNAAMTNFLLNRGKTLKRILLLIDARHGMKTADFKFLEHLQDCLSNPDSFKNGNQDQDAPGSESKENELRPVEGRRRANVTLPPIQIVLTKSDLVTQNDLARRVVQINQQLSDALIRETSSLPVMLCSAKAGLGFNNIRGQVARGGILELQRELAALVKRVSKND